LTVKNTPDNHQKNKQESGRISTSFLRRAWAMKLVYTFAAVALVAPTGATQAAETVTHQYDALGRLVQSAKSGGPASGAQTTTAYDPAGNRSNQTVTGAGGGGAPPPPPPPPPPTNNPPVANPDNAGSMARCSLKTVNLVANDTDPNGNYPLSLVSAVGSGVSVTVVSATSIEIESGVSTGSKTISYVVADSLGATANGSATVSVAGGSCDL
jgi:hypothetical protein